jgi:hypothetical protein
VFGQGSPRPQDRELRGELANDHYKGGIGNEQIIENG